MRPLPVKPTATPRKLSQLVASREMTVIRKKSCDDRLTRTATNVPRCTVGGHFETLANCLYDYTLDGDDRVAV